MSAVPALADELLDIILDRAPTMASLLGIPGRDDRIADLSEAADQAFTGRLTGVLDRARELDPAGLTPTDRITRTVVVHEAQTLLTEIRSRSVEYTVSDQICATAPSLLSELTMLPITSVEQAETYRTRLAALPAFFATLADRHRIGIAAGRRPVAHLVAAAVNHLDHQLANLDTLRRQPTTAAADSTAADSTAADSGPAEIMQQCAEVVSTLAGPAISGYRDMLAAEVLPHGRGTDRVGLCWLPAGEETYAALVRGYTTTGHSPDELHRTGLRLIATLAEEYREIGSQVFGGSDLDEIFTRLRADPALRWRSAEEMLVAARQSVLRAEAAAPHWFRTLPTQACVVAAQPAGDSPNAPPYYLVASLDGTRPGTYFVPTKQPTELVRYNAEATAFHEGVPGHHFEATTRQERTDLPRLRRLVGLSAFSEGWALYAERLADEMGLYSDDLARLGMLTLDSMRAARLVVDTGLHAQGWTRQQAIDYLHDNTAMVQAEVESEIDRYIALPGQALTYMVGRLEIQRLRRQAERTMGDRFDIRAFHEAVLSQGRLPLPTLAEVITDWQISR